MAVNLPKAAAFGRRRWKYWKVYLEFRISIIYFKIDLTRIIACPLPPLEKKRLVILVRHTS